MSLIRHFTTSSRKRAAASASTATVAGGVASRRSSDSNEAVRSQCSSTLSISTLSALTSAGPSSISALRGSSSRSSSAAMQRCSLACPTADARRGSWNTCISALSTYLQARAVEAPGAAAAASKMGATRAARSDTSASTSDAIAASAASSPEPTAPITSWHRHFMPSTAAASAPEATVSSARLQPARAAAAAGGPGASSQSIGAAPEGSPRSWARSRRTKEETAAPNGRSTADATLAMGEPTVAAVAASLPGAAVNRDAAPPTGAPARTQAPGAPSPFPAISLAALANLSSSASRTSGPTRPTCRHASSPATLYAHVRQASAAARVGASRASASLATSAIALEPPLSTTSRPCLSMSSSSASSISRRVLVFFESRPRT